MFPAQKSFGQPVMRPTEPAGTVRHLRDIYIVDSGPEISANHSNAKAYLFPTDSLLLMDNRLKERIETWSIYVGFPLEPALMETFERLFRRR